jgi:hypothetical protein
MSTGLELVLLGTGSLLPNPDPCGAGSLAHHVVDREFRQFLAVAHDPLLLAHSHLLWLAVCLLALGFRVAVQPPVCHSEHRDYTQPEGSEQLGRSSSSRQTRRSGSGPDMLRRSEFGAEHLPGKQGVDGIIEGANGTSGAALLPQAWPGQLRG